MKKTVTVSISLPIEISGKLDLLAEELSVSRSALLTAVVSVLIKQDWCKSSLNSIYGKKEK